MTTLSFPGLGIEELLLNKTAISLPFGLTIQWYGVLITLGIILAFLHTAWRGKTLEGVKTDDVIDIGIFVIVFAIIGARLYYVLTDSGNTYETFYEVIAIWKGGLALYGGVIGGALAVLLVTLFKKINPLRFYDMVVPGVIIAQTVGRWGNFVNGEAYGSEITSVSTMHLFGHEFEFASGEGTLFHVLRMGVMEDPLTHRPIDHFAYVHPTFLYESAWNLLGFLLMTLLYKRKKFHGQILLIYCAWYGFGRMWIEGLRTDSLLIPGTGLRISQCLGLACFVIGTALLIFFWIRFRHNDPFQKVAMADGPSKRIESVAHYETLWGRTFERALEKRRAKRRGEEPDEEAVAAPAEQPSQKEDDSKEVFATVEEPQAPVSADVKADDVSDAETENVVAATAEEEIEEEEESLYEEVYIDEEDVLEESMVDETEEN